MGPPGLAQQIRRALRVVAGSNISRMAAALSYRTVFGLIPVLAIGVAVLGGFASDAQVTDTVTRVLDLTGLDEIIVDPEVGDTAGSARLDEWLQTLVSKVRNVSFVAIGLTGLFILAYAAISFMVEIERSANHIYRAPTGRSWVRRVTQYWTTLTLGSIFLVGTFYVGERLTQVLTDLATRDTPQAQVEPGAEQGAGEVRPGDGASPDAGADGAGGVVLEPRATAVDAAGSAPGGGQDAVAETRFGAKAAGMSVSLLIDFILLFFIYTTVPNARVNMRCAGIGAALAAVIWELGKWGFKFIVLNSSAQTLYGAIALVPLFLLWVYITWIIVLSGLQISYVLQHFRAFAVSDDERRGPVLVDPLTLVRVAVEVARGFAAGRTAAVSDVARAVGLDERTSLAMLERLSDAKVLNRVPEGQEREVFALARPAEEISATHLLELAGRMTESGKVEGESERLGALRRAQVAAAAGLNLAELMGPEQPEGAAGQPPDSPGASPAPGPAG